MAVKPASLWASNWQGASGKATTNYNSGVANTTADWQALTLAAIPRMQAGFDAAVANGTVAAGIQSVSTAQWKADTQAKSARYTAGYTDGLANYTAAANQLQPVMQQIVNSLTPRGDITANIDRVRQIDMALHAIRGQYRH